MSRSQRRHVRVSRGSELLQERQRERVGRASGGVYSWNVLTACLLLTLSGCFDKIQLWPRRAPMSSEAKPELVSLPV